MCVWGGGRQALPCSGPRRRQGTGPPLLCRLCFSPPVPSWTFGADIHYAALPPKEAPFFLTLASTFPAPSPRAPARYVASSRPCAQSDAEIEAVVAEAMRYGEDRRDAMIDAILADV